MSTTATRAPSSVMRRHVARPMPDPPPVTTARRLSRSPICTSWVSCIVATRSNAPRWRVRSRPRWNEMGKATLKGILARKLRLALTTLAVLLGVAFVSGTYVLTDTMERSFDTIFRRTVTDVDLVVRARDPYTGGGSQRTRIPDATLARVRAVDGVATADGTTFGYAQLVGHGGDSIQNGLAPTLGLSWPESGAGPLALAHDGKSRPPRGDREVLVDEGTARANGFKGGDHVRVLLQGPAQQFTIVGLFGLKGQADLGGVTVAAFDLPTSERVLASAGALHAKFVTTAPGPPPGARPRKL